MSFVRHAAAPLLGIVLSLVFLVESRGLDEVARGDQLGPGFWPRLVLAGLGLACAAKIVDAWRRRRALPRPESSLGAVVDLEPEAVSEISRPRLAMGIVLIIVYVAATPWIGFAVATAAFIVAFMWLCGARSPLALTANASIGTIGLLYLFIKLVYLPLPKGAGPFETLTLALYRALRLF